MFAGDKTGFKRGWRKIYAVLEHTVKEFPETIDIRRDNLAEATYGTIIAEYTLCYSPRPSISGDSQLNSRP